MPRSSPIKTHRSQTLKKILLVILTATTHPCRWQITPLGHLSLTWFSTISLLLDSEKGNMNVILDFKSKKYWNCIIERQKGLVGFTDNTLRGVRYKHSFPFLSQIGDRFCFFL